MAAIPVFATICEHFLYAAELAYNDNNPLGLVATLGHLELPCRSPRAPLAPDTIAAIYRRILPECIARVLEKCIDKIAGKLILDDLWILDRALDFETIEEAEKYWEGLPTYPTIVIKGRLLYGEEKTVMFLMPVPFIAPGAPLVASGIIVLRASNFVKLHGPAGLQQPNLLNHYKRYKIKLLSGGLQLEESSKPYYED